MAESKCSSCHENWKKPDKSIKLVVKKRAQRPGNSASNVLKARNLNATETMRTQLKRHNPFSCSPRKKANIARGSKAQENIKLFNDLDKLASPGNKNKMEESSQLETMHQMVKPSSGYFEQSTKTTGSPVSKISSRTLPLDWSLKTRARFTSNQPFSWCSKLLCSQETEGICNFVQVRESSNISEQKSSVFQQNIMYWVHPVLPWLNLFPRLTSETKLTSKVPSVGENVDIANALQTSWYQSFHSLFNLVRCGRCHYFYLCSPQSTMLFRAANIGGLPSVSVIITPTTKGMREAFDKQGIAYTMPVLHQSKNNYDDEDDENRCGQTRDGEFDENSKWLESMGVGKETLPQLQQSKVKQERAELRNIDHQGSSVTIITGSHTQALFNYLLNCKSLVAKTGHLVGVPPTLLAPVAFEGATLQSLSTKQGIIKQGKQLEQRYSLDVNGPILPGILSKLCKTFEITQDQEFTASVKLLQATTPFNVATSEKNAKKQSSAESTTQNYIEQCSDLSMTGLTQIKCEDGLYSWETS